MALFIHGAPAHTNAYATTAVSNFTYNVLTSFNALPFPAQAENAIRQDHPEVEWLRRRVREITDLVAA